MSLVRPQTIFPTLKDVAFRAKVSDAAVSVVLRGRDCNIRVSEAVRNRIFKAARSLNYRPHRYAQIMRNGRSGIIGMIHYGGLLQVAAERAIHVAKAIHAAGYQLLASDVLWHKDGVRAICDMLLDSRADGLLLVGTAPEFPLSELKRIQNARIPMVGLSGVRLPGIPQVRADVCQGMFDLTQHLLALGYRKLVLLTLRTKGKGANRAWPMLERINGFIQAATAGGLSKHAIAICETDPIDALSPYRSGKDGMKRILQQRLLPEVVVCSNDDLAIGAFAACVEAGLRVPDNIAITGFDNSQAGEFSAVPLTSVAQPTEAMAKMAVGLLTRLMRGEKLSGNEELIKMPCRLVARQSCGEISDQ
ncbi:MAG: LacI family DNA-binding transcriptional regulator [Verrucomicrobia bacterium]|nr:LacI family DNA-binding transcriptional regulator [Verrucomicrobiota bacterium]